MESTTDRGVQDLLKAAKNTNNLPSPQGVALEVLRLVADEATTAEDLARVVENDPAISARVLKAVNSPLAGVSRQIGSVQQAVTRLGFQTIKAITIALSLLAERREGPCKEFDYQRFWSESLARGVAMRHLAGHLKAMPADEAFTYGLLSLIGRLALVSVFPEKYANVLIAVGTEDRSELAEAEQAVFQIDSEELSALMMLDWGMPRAYTALQCEDLDGGKQTGEQTETMRPMMQLCASMAKVLVESNTFRDQLTAILSVTPVTRVRWSS